MKFTDLLSLNVACEMLHGPTACLLLIGGAAPALAGQWAAAGTLPHTSGIQRVLFGLPVQTLPYPILVQSLMTEHNTPLDQLSLFGWIEDNAILEPRAEVFGLTPLAEDPVLFLRDLDLDRPPEAYIHAGHSSWLRVAGVVIARREMTTVPVMLEGADGALSALEVVLPVEVQGFVKTLRMETSAGRPLHHVLRAHRRAMRPEVMAQCDGWRVLSRAARFVLAGSANDNLPFRLDAPRRW